MLPHLPCSPPMPDISHNHSQQCGSFSLPSYLQQPPVKYVILVVHNGSETLGISGSHNIPNLNRFYSIPVIQCFHTCALQSVPSLMKAMSHPFKTSEPVLSDGAYSFMSHVQVTAHTFRSRLVAHVCHYM